MAPRIKPSIRRASGRAGLFPQLSQYRLRGLGERERNLQGADSIDLLKKDVCAGVFEQILTECSAFADQKAKDPLAVLAVRPVFQVPIAAKYISLSPDGYILGQGWRR